MKTEPFEDEETTVVEAPIPMEMLQQQPRTESGPVVARTQTKDFPWSPGRAAAVIK